MKNWDLWKGKNAKITTSRCNEGYMKDQVQWHIMTGKVFTIAKVRHEPQHKDMFVSDFPYFV